MPVDSHSPDRSKRPTRPAILLTGAVVAALLLLPQAAALAGEVHFDADSPAGKEYALPLDRAREEAAGAGETDGPAGEKAPLFGAGVSGGSGGPQGGAGSSGSGSGGDAAGRQDAQGQGAKVDRAAAAAAISDSDSGYALSSAILWVAALAALAGIAALVSRVLQRPRPT